MGITKPWPVRWFFASRSNAGAVQKAIGGKRIYARFLEEDEAMRNVVRKKIGQAGISAIEIERTVNDVKILIKAARPGIVIGRGGKGIEELTQEIEKALRKLRNPSYKPHLSVNVEELKRNEVSATYTAQLMAWDIERRLPFRRTMKKYLDQLMQHREVRGAKVMLSGRLGGAEISRREMLKNGSLPLQTLRANIDYGTATAMTTYGTIGVKVWVHKGEITK